MNTFTILLIDDDEVLLDLLGEHIRAGGYRCQTANNGILGIQLAEEVSPDLVVLDVMMPDVDGWRVCQKLREHSAIPIIMLTAKGEEYDKLRGFHLGVDDYVTKPFSFAELLARIGAVLSRTRRSGASTRQVVRGEITVDFDKHHVLLAGAIVDLTPTEYRLLETLARYANQTVPTETLLDIVWGEEYQAQADQVKHYIWSLRKKIERDAGDPQRIITVRGFGYRFD
jgi:DNA-binding response OmpR family regulator